MVSFLVDFSGDIYFDPQGKMKEISGKNEVRQRIVNLFSTQKGSEIFMPEYGFDRVSMIRTPFMDEESSLNYYVMEALNPQNLYGVSGVYNINTKIEIIDTVKTGKISLDVITSEGTTSVEFNIGNE